MIKWTGTKYIIHVPNQFSMVSFFYVFFSAANSMSFMFSIKFQTNKYVDTLFRKQKRRLYRLDGICVLQTHVHMFINFFDFFIHIFKWKRRYRSDNNEMDSGRTVKLSPRFYCNNFHSTKNDLYCSAVGKTPAIGYIRSKSSLIKWIKFAAGFW